MANLPTSLRRTMVMLLVGMCMIVMVFYWNQSALKPISYMNSMFKPTPRNNPNENNWTFRCNGDRCTREHYDPKAPATGSAPNRRVPFMTCAMTCGEPNIWPMPTGRTKISRRSLTLLSEAATLHVDTKFPAVEQMLRAAFDLFVGDMQQLEMNGAASAAAEQQQQQQLAGSLSGRRTTSASAAQAASSAERRTVDKGESAAECRTDAEREEQQQQRLLFQQQQRLNQHYDIQHLVVKIAVTSIPDVHLNLDMDESYNLTLTNDNGRISHVHIHSKSFFGARHALATLLQLVWYDDEARLLRILSAAQVQDEPRFRYRGLMLDTSRHYFSVQSIKRTIAGMAATKLNRFHWHITDSQSFPLVSRHYPQMAEYGAYSPREVYTAADVRDIAEFARVRGVQVIPEIDAPAHAGNGWDWGPKHGLGELSLCINQQPWSFYCGEPPCGQLNPRNNHTYEILQRLYEELLEATGPTDFFHLGGDEVNLECWAQHFNDTDIRALWCDFMLQAYARLKAANGGRAPHLVSVWSSGLTSTACLSKNAFAVQVWGGSTWPENYELLANGYSLVLSHVDAWYLDCGFGSWRATGEAACSPYRTWQQVYRHRPWERMNVEPGRMKQILGGEACLWTEQVDESALDTRLWPRSAAIAERLWTDPIEDRELDAVPKQTFSRMSVFRNRLVNMGLRAEPIFPRFCAQNPDECV